MLIPEQLKSVSIFLSTCRRMKNYLKKAESLDVGIAFYGGSLNTLDMLYDEIERSIRNDAVDDDASPALHDIRRKIQNTNACIKEKLESILRSRKECFTDAYVSTRNGRFVLPVKKEYKSRITGTVIDSSGTGNTFFIEPAAVSRLQEELADHIIDEENEVRKILYTLTGLVEEHASELKTNMDCMEALDFVFAKAKHENDARVERVFSYRRQRRKV
jgi:dsDNA-specific endonuclease/ATPase MutS2